MRIIALMENTPSEKPCFAEHGLCFYIESGKHKILMDTGQSEKTWQNARAAGIDLKQIDTAVISHGHYDHGGGLMSFLEINPDVPVYIQDSAFADYFSIRNGMPVYIGLPEISASGLIRIRGSHRIDEELFLLGDLSDKRPFPSANQRLKKRIRGELMQDDFIHEQCLVITENDKIFLFSGCAHHGILNILDSFRKTFGRDPNAVFSGFHMSRNDGYSEADIAAIRETAHELCSYDTLFYTCHCTGEVPYQIMKGIMHDQLRQIRCLDEVIMT